MSPSSSATRAPAWLSATARFTDTVVLPTPPLPAPTAMTLRTPRTGCLLKSAVGTARTLAVMSMSTVATPGIRATAARACCRIVSRAEEPWMACSIVKTTRLPSMRTFLTNFAVTMSRSIEGSRTPRNASRMVDSVNSALPKSQSPKPKAQSLNPIRGHLTDQRQLEFLPLVGLEHQQQPEDGGRGNHDEDHQQRPEDRDELKEDVDRDDPEEHERRLHRVEPDELVLLLHEQEDDPRHEADQIAQRGGHVRVHAGGRLFSVLRRHARKGLAHRCAAGPRTCKSPAPSRRAARTGSSPPGRARRSAQASDAAGSR